MAASSMQEEFECQLISEDEYELLLNASIPAEMLTKIEESRKKHVSDLLLQYDSERYPMWTKDQWRAKVKGKPTITINLLQDEHDKIKKEVDLRLKKYVTRSEFVNEPDKPEKLRIVLLGKTGEGKSAVGNTITGVEHFESKSSAHSVTRLTEKCSSKLENVRISVLDTPGLQDPHIPKDKIFSEIARVIVHFPDGIHAFLYVINASRHRFTEEDAQVLDDIKEQFGKDILKYCILILTHVDTNHEFDLPTYIEDVHSKEGPYSGLLHTLGWKVVGVNNKADSLYERKQNQARIISHVIRMLDSNIGDEVYTNVLFEKAKALKLQSVESAISEDFVNAVCDYINDHEEVLSQADVPNECLFFLKERVPSASHYNDDTLRVKTNTEINRYKNIHFEMTKRVEQTGKGWLCVII